jgi:hypothetical protein
MKGENKMKKLTPDEIKAIHEEAQYLSLRYRALREYLKVLGEKISKTREQIIDELKLFVAGNDTQRTIQDLSLAAIIILEKEPMGRAFYDHEWLMSYSDSDVKVMFEKFENYFKEIPGVELPEKDEKAKEWFEKQEKEMRYEK